MDFDFEDMDTDNDDIILRMEHEDGTHITFLTAPASVFTQQDVLEPLVTELGKKNIFVAFNGELLARLVNDSVEKNGDVYGNGASAFLPMTLLINTGVKAVEDYMRKMGDK